MYQGMYVYAEPLQRVSDDEVSTLLYQYSRLIEMNEGAECFHAVIMSVWTRPRCGDGPEMDSEWRVYKVLSILVTVMLSAVTRRRTVDLMGARPRWSSARCVEQAVAVHLGSSVFLSSKYIPRKSPEFPTVL